MARGTGGGGHQPAAPHASRSSRLRLIGRPYRKPPRLPSVRTIRWQGTNSAAAFIAQAPAAARSLDEAAVTRLVMTQSREPPFGLPGVRRVGVLELNLALDAIR